MIDLSLLEDFVTGAGESLDEMENALLELETNPNNLELLNTIFRAMHTIKGAAQFVGLDKVSALSHVLEDLLDLLRNGQRQVTIEIVDLMIKTKDRISLLVTDLERTQTEQTEVDDLIAQINHHLTEDSATVIAESPTAASAPQDDVEISSFLEETTGDEDLSAFLTEDNLEDDFTSFLSESTEEQQVSFLSDENPQEELSTFITEEKIDDDISLFLSGDTQEQPEDFLSVENNDNNPEDDLSVFLAESSADNEISEFLSEETQPEIATELAPELNEDFVLPDEEYDQELFGIFIQQLKEKFSLLNDYVEKLPNANNPAELLNASLEALESLKFSANYMAYQQLTIIYVKWIEEVVDCLENLTIVTEPMSFAFMNDYLRKLQTIFPQLQETPTAVKTPTSELNPFVHSLDNLVIDEATETATLAFINDLIQEQPNTVAAEKFAVVSIPEPSGVEINYAEDDAEESDLFKKLSNALDSSIEHSITSEPINELFGALLATSKEEKSRAKAEKEHSLQLNIKTLDQANQEIPTKVINAIKEEVKGTSTAEATPKSNAVINAVDNNTVKKAKTEVSADKAFKKSIRVDADKIDSLMNQVGELIVDRAYFFQLASEINELQQYLKSVTGLGQKDLKPVRTFAYRFSEAVISLGRTSNELQEGVMKVRMLPIAQIFNRYPRLVHDLAHTNAKKVQLEIRGEETELDKMIIEEISDPLIHMIRNAIGHGIETPEMRKKAGKPETGTLILEAYHESNHIVIEVTDDGKGIDTDKIKAKAEEMNLFSKEELNRMTKEDLTRFIMMPGFSTAKEINSTSGRGVGMDVVKKNIEKLNGTIEVESKIGIETKIRLKIPLTLAIIQALLVRVGEDSFTIPLANVEETLRVSESEISIMEETEVMYLRGKTLPIFRLATLFRLQSSQKSGETDFFVVVVNTGNQRIGLMVDALLGQEEVVIKPLADYLHEQNCFSGATIIGDGRISLILDVYELINMTTDKQIKKHHEQEKKSLASLAE
jgi:two-component system chemotaxis sensor kinase CheA